MLFQRLLVVGAFLASFTLSAQEISDTKFGKGLINFVAKDSTFSVRFAPRIQGRFNTNWNYNEDSFDAADYNFSIRRARLKFDGFAYSPKLKYKIELGLSNRDVSGASAFNRNTPRIILDAVVMWNFYENFELWAGQTKLPGNRERVISSANLQTVDRSLVNGEFNIDRDMGMQLHHSINVGPNFLVREAFAFSQGEGRNVTAGNLGGYQYTGRIEALPMGDFADYTGADLSREQTPKLAVGFTYDHNANAVRTRSNSGTYMVNDTGLHEADINTIFLDAMFKYKGWSVMAEYADRSSDQPIAINSDGTPTGAVVNVGDGFNIQSGYVFKNNFQVTARYTTIELEEEITGAGIETQYTLGLSKYIVGHKLKVQTDVSLNDYEDNIDNSLMYRLQIDFHF